MPIVETKVLGTRVHAISSLGLLMDQVQAPRDRAWLMTFVNPASVVTGKRAPHLHDLLARFDVIAPDGNGVVFAIWAEHRIRAERVSFDGTSLAPLIFRLACSAGWSMVLVGGRPGVAEKARQQIEREYPEAQIVGTFDGYTDRRILVSHVSSLSPDVVIAGMGVVHQEAFLVALSDAGWAGAGFTCGGFLDQLAQSGLNYYPEWIDRLQLRFAYRLAKEPSRLWRRYLLEYSEFGFLLGRSLVFRKKKAAKNAANIARIDKTDQGWNRTPWR